MNSNEKFVSNVENKADKKANVIVRVKDFDELDYIRLVGDSEEIKMGGLPSFRKNDYIDAYSYGANPCICGVAETKDGETYMFHSFGDVLTDEQEEIIKNSKRGVVGGNKKTLAIYSDEFINSNIKVIQPRGDNDDFNIVFVKGKNKFKVAPGSYYYYEDGSSLYDSGSDLDDDTY
jgi:hypothetical protein